VPNYAKVKYANVYPGVDLVYYGNQGKLEYDFVVQPDAEPNQIVLDVGAGLAPPKRAPQAAPLHVNEAGDLVVGADGGEIIFHKPIVYQPATYNELRTKNGGGDLVEGHYVLRDDNRIGFELANYDRRRPVVIDPTLAYSTYLGGSGSDLGSGIAVDGLGNAYVTGSAGSGFPTTTGAFQTSGNGDAFVSKLNAAGSGLVYSTYLGGGGTDGGSGIAVDASGNVYVTGSTGSHNFPTTAGAFQTTYGGGFADVFMSKLNPDGSALVYSTYLGGARGDVAFSAAVDTSGNAYITGYTGSSNFPTTPGAFQTTFGGGGPDGDAFVSELNAAGSALVFSTYLGGSGDDTGHGITVDASGSAYVTGGTDSSNFPISPGAYQTTCPGGGSRAFISRLNVGGSALLYSTYLCGASFGSFGQGGNMVVDASGNLYVTGTAFSNFPTTPGAFQTSSSDFFDAFVTKLNPTGSAPVYSTLLGGSFSDAGSSIALDALHPCQCARCVGQCLRHRLCSILRLPYHPGRLPDHSRWGPGCLLQQAQCLRLGPALLHLPGRK
jgi:hypothetical protein